MGSREHSVDELVVMVEHLQDRVSELEAENQRLRKELEQRDDRVDTLEARLRQYENPHTPPSKRRPGSTGRENTDDDTRTDGGTIGRDPGHEPAFRTPPQPDETVDVTLDTCPCCGDSLGDAERVTARLVEEIPEPQPVEVTQYNRHHYACDGCGAEAVAPDPHCPTEGQFGVNVIAEAALDRYEYRLPYRKIAERFDQLHDLSMSGASAWHATERAARASRCEYKQIRQQIQHADVVHVDETGIKRNGDQAWIWTFRTGEHTLFAVRESRGSAVPAEVLGEGFAGTIICDGWTAYPAFSSNLQRCWAHLLRETEDVAADHEEAEPIHRYLQQMYAGLTSWLETDPPARERARMHRAAQNGLESLVDRSVPDGPVATLRGKIDGGLDHWLTFVGEPAVAPTNNAAENALREPVVLRKIIGTLRNDRGMFVHETLLSLVATWRQQGRNPHEELKRVVRDNEMIPRAQAVPTVASLG